MENRRFLCLGVTILFVASVILGVKYIESLDESKIVDNTPKIEEKKKEISYKTYDMYISINPFVRLTFKAKYETCENSNDLCFTGEDEIIDYELINDDAKTVYESLDFKGLNVMDVLILLCDTARDNNIAYDSISITTNWMDMYDDQLLMNSIKEKSKYEFDFDIFVDVKEYIDDNEIKQEYENSEEIVEYIVSFNRDNGDAIIKRKVKENEVVAEVKSGNKSGYTFVEWQLDGKKYDFNTPVTKDITLVAKWKKGEVTTTTTTVVSEEKPNNTEEATTTKAASTVDRINLNDNIMVTEQSYGIYSGVGCGGWYGRYVFTTNASTILAEYKGYANSYSPESHSIISGLGYDDYDALVEACKTVTADFNSKLDDLTYDTAKESAAKSILEKYKNAKTRGISDFDYSIDDHAFTYSYKYLYIENAESFGDFGKKFNQLQNLSDLNSAFKSIEYVSDFCYGGCGSGDSSKLQMLNESLCSKYNLTCDRW